MNNRLNGSFLELVEEIKKNLEFLPDKPEENPETTARSLWLIAAGKPVSAELSKSLELPPLDSESKIRLAEMLKMRLSGVPLSYITGRQRFLDIEFIVEPGGYITRKETELLGNTALKILRDISNEKEEVKVIDLCTGMGNLAISFAYHVKNASVIGSDIMPEAVELARKNAVFNKVDNRVEFRTGDLFEAFNDDALNNSFDLITCNPPYMSSIKYEALPPEIKEHEPRFAFDGGSFGMNIVSRLIKESPVYLKSGGWLGFEIGLGQGEVLEKRLIKNSIYHNIKTVNDEKGNIRAILAQLV